MSCTKSMPGTQRIGQGSSSLEGSAEGTVAWTIPAGPTGGDEGSRGRRCVIPLDMLAYRRAIPRRPDPGLAASYGVKVILEGG
jgi:hypothetical protein